MKAIVYKSKPNAKRVKFHLPYDRLDWRIKVKAMNGSFYHKPQQLWSVVNTATAIDELKALFGDEVEMKDEASLSL